MVSASLIFVVLMIAGSQLPSTEGGIVQCHGTGHDQRDGWCISSRKHCPPGEVEISPHAFGNCPQTSPCCTYNTTSLTPKPKKGCSEVGGFLKIDGTQKCIKVFDDVDRNWYQANEKCHSEGLTMLTTSNINAVEIRKILFNLYGGPASFAWLDARFNGVQYLWKDGEQISNIDKLWYNGKLRGPPMPKLIPDYCLLLLNSKAFMDDKPDSPYWSTPCQEIKYGRKAVCELI